MLEIKNLHANTVEQTAEILTGLNLSVKAGAWRPSLAALRPTGRSATRERIVMCFDQHSNVCTSN